MVWLGRVHFGVAVTTALAFGVDNSAFGVTALAFSNTACSHLAALFKSQLSAFAALMLLHIVLLESFFDHGLVLPHVSLTTFSLTAFFHGGCGRRHFRRH